MRPAVARFYTIAGRTLEIEALDDRAADLVRTLLADIHLTAATFPSAPQNSCIRVAAQGGLPSVPSGFQTFEMELGRCYTDGEKYYFHIGDAMIVASPRSSQVVEVWIDEAGLRSDFLNSIMPYALEVALKPAGLYQLHAAGVVEPENGACALLIGGSGCGKSTLTLRLAAAGWRYLTDDSLFLAEEGAAVRAWGTRRFFASYEKSLVPFGAAELKEALDGYMPGNPDKQRLLPSVMFPGGFTESNLPTRLFFTSITGKARSQVFPCSPSDTMTRLIKFSAWAASYDPKMARGHLRVLGQLVNQSRAFSLSAGVDVLNEPGFAATLLHPYMG